MEKARLIARRSTCRRKQVGAILVRNWREIASGYVGAPSGFGHCSQQNCSLHKPCTRTVHAEANAIAWSAREGIPTFGSAMYTTLSPCNECAKLIINAGIQSVIFDELYRDQKPLVLLKMAGITVHKWSDIYAQLESQVP